MTAIARQIPETRDGTRRNMFLGAVLRRGTDQVVVKIRNMSALGALIDSPVVPEPNSRIELVRGTYVAGGRVVWSEARRCGIRFSSEISVNDWLAPIETQQPVPAVQAVPRQDSPPLEDAPATADLQEIARIVDRAARALASDPMLLRVHMTEARDLMRASRMLERLRQANNPASVGLDSRS